MTDNWPACLAWILAREGGYVNDLADPGGATNKGITLRTLSAWRGRPVTIAEVRALTDDEAGAIYRANYWSKVRGDDLPSGIDLSVMDATVLSGPAQGARFLQRAVHVADDGAIGPATLAAVLAADAGVLIDDIASQRGQFYRGLVAQRPASDRFLAGWLNRVELTRRRAQSMAAAS